MDNSETTKKLAKTKDTTTNLYLKDSIIKQAGPNAAAVRTKTLNSMNQYYHQTRTVQSGDVHPNPGPTNMTTRIILLITILSIIHHFKENKKIVKGMKPTTSVYAASIRYLKNRIIRKERKFNNTTYNICTILILLSGDVHLNPGPKVTNTCSICNLEDNEDNSARCDTCLRRCHISCAASINGELMNKSFEWICPNIKCKPNHHTGLEIKSEESTNRYMLLAKAEDITKPKPKQKLNKSEKKKTLDDKINKPKEPDLWKELTKIKATDFVGTEICRACHKNIKGTHQAISCDNCQRWIHRKCSDMNIRRYKENQKKISFEWNCNVCRQDEEMVYNIPDITKLKMEDMPEAIIKMLPTKEMLIIHMNCRSVINKLEELEQICIELNPDIVCLTETWMDDSIPIKSHIPSGYKIIRKDRSDIFKQKYSKKNGGGIAVIYKEHIKLEVKEYMTDQVEEILWIHVKTKESFMLGTIYRASYTDTTSASRCGPSI